MHTRDHQIKPEYRQGMMRVFHYINQNLTGDVSLETLAGIANYSPFHFQKIFLENVKETPKQYVVRLRLERAAHYLKMYRDLPVAEIAIGCGFSSPSIFSRAFKNYFGISAESFRKMSLLEISTMSKANNKAEEPSWLITQSDEWQKIQISPPPVIKSIKAMKFACVQTMLSHPESIYFSFKSLLQWAIPNGIVSDSIKYIGILLDVPFFTPLEKCRYLTGIELKEDIKLKAGIELIMLKDGKYASFSMNGNYQESMNHSIALNHSYLDDLGYDMKDFISYEIFDECPAEKPYETINKTILLPVKAKS